MLPGDGFFFMKATFSSDGPFPKGELGDETDDTRATLSPFPGPDIFLHHSTHFFATTGNVSSGRCVVVTGMNECPMYG